MLILKLMLILKILAILLYWYK